jgi:hypothetical protein
LSVVREEIGGLEESLPLQIGPDVFQHLEQLDLLVDPLIEVVLEEQTRLEAVSGDLQDFLGDLELDAYSLNSDEHCQVQVDGDLEEDVRESEEALDSSCEAELPKERLEEHDYDVGDHGDD